MTRPLVSALALVACFAAPALAGDLTGIYRVDGALADGTTYSGHAVLSPQKSPGHYTVSARVDAGSSVVRWQATATRVGAELTTRHWRRGTGFNQVIQGPGSDERVTGAYAIETQGGSEIAFEGTLGTPTARGKVRFVRDAEPLVAFEPGAIDLEPGALTEVPVRAAPEGLFDLLWFDAPPKSACSWRKGSDDSLLIEAHQPGFYTFSARLGRGGPVIAELRVDVRSDVMARVLERVRVEAADGDGLKPIVVFDLDDTLFDTRYRTLRILHEYAAQSNEPRLETTQPEQIHYELHDTLIELGYSQAELDSSGLAKDLRKFWLRRFFRDDRLSDDAAFTGAPAYLHALVEAGAEIAYVTGRKTTALAASREKLRADGYPVDGQHLFFKPIQVPGTAKLKTYDFKGWVAREELPKLGEAIAAFDNEPSNCNAFLKNLPEGSINVFLDTRHEPDAPALLEGVETVQASAFRQ